jgi:uncharacterized membrane-anchored protein
MSATAALLASLALASSAAAGVPREVRWILGPASVELGEGRVRCALPDGVALASGVSARSVLEAVSDGADGSELAVVSPTSPSRTWFVIVAWRSAGRADALPVAAGPARDGQVVWLERPRRDEQTGRVGWTVAGSTRGGPTVNQHVEIAANGGAVEVTLVAPVEELAEARLQLGRIVDGLGVEPPDPNAKRR